MAIIYGIDTNKKVSPADVRNAIVTCFWGAHKKVAQESFALSTKKNATIEHKTTEIYIEELVRKAFTETGGDFDHPDKEALIKATENLGVFSKTFRNQEVINKHTNKIKELIALLD